MKKLSTIAIALAVAALICNFIMVTFDGVPFSIALGILGIGFALASKGDDPALSKQAKTALILSAIALAFGIFLFAVTYVSTKLMADPETSRRLMEEMQKILPQMPEDVQEMFKPYL